MGQEMLFIYFFLLKVQNICLTLLFKKTMMYPFITFFEDFKPGKDYNTKYFKIVSKHCELGIEV